LYTALELYSRRTVYMKAFDTVKNINILLIFIKKIRAITALTDESLEISLFKALVMPNPTIIQEARLKSIILRNSRLRKSSAHLISPSSICS
jgi:hypothetical protein